jgi:SAM-dependent methyltransferase
MNQEYTFDNVWVQARARLGLLESVCDPGSIRHLERIGVAAGWQYLEVGAGGGSIAAWLCENVGPTGHVLATDLDTRFLDRLDSPNLAVRRHDITVEALPDAAFDLVYARLVLLHLPERDRGSRSMIGALKPGGWLLVEETGSATFPPDLRLEGAALFERGMAASIQAQTGAGADYTYDRRLYADARAAGLFDVEGKSACR